MKMGRGLLISLVLLGILLVLVGGRAVAAFIAELQWYGTLGLESVFWTRWGAALAVRGVAAIVVTAAVFANLWIVARSLGTIRVRRRYANIEIAERLPRSYVMAALAAISLFSGWWLSAGMADPLPVLAALNPAQWGLADPIFGHDAAFYVFQLPILNRIQTLGGLLVFWIALLAVAAYVATGAIKVVDNRPTMSALARRHLGVLAASFLVLYAANEWLDRYGLIVDGGGFAGGLGYTDVNARLPVKLLVVVVTLLAAAAIGYGLWIGDLRAPIAAGILLFLALVGGEAIYPSSIQRFVVEPNEFPREQGYIQDHLEFTRMAFRLDEVERVPLPYESRPDLAADALVDQLQRVPLWDPRPLLTTYRQQQGLFRYYTFASVHHDRYGEGDRREPVAISVRELETTELEDAAQTWQNIHLNYVSGEGAVATPVSQMAPDGTPIFYVWDLDPPKLAPEAPPELRLENPNVYFGERTREYVIVPSDAEPIGVPLDAAWKKLVFAWAFQSQNILLSGDLTRDSKIVYRRRVADRVQEVAPFLRVSDQRSVHPIIADGRLVWMVDAYTSSSSFPLSQIVGFENRGVRYIRNSVKATVDAVTGEVHLYAADPDDPILRTYAGIFEGLFQPLQEMPENLQVHLRYPVQLMHLQAQVLGAYHLLDARAFYEQQDVWSEATEQYRGTPTPMEPTYSMFQLPEADEMEFLLSVPFVPRGRQNMTALFVTRNDTPNYGQQMLYLLPRDELVPGPQQIEAMIDQDPEISQQLALWRRGGSDVIRGHLMIVPIDNTLVYVEPLFLEAENAAIPQLERVILARAGDVVMQPTFEAAAAALLSNNPPEGIAAPRDNAEPATSDLPILTRARELLGEADRQLRTGDWAGFGRSWDALRQALGGSGDDF